MITLYENNNIRYEFEPERSDLVLGQGGMGIIFKGKRIHNNEFEHVAVKVLHRELPDGVISRARREASVQIVHEHLLRMYGFFETRDNQNRPIYHVISEYIDGRPLSDILQQQNCLPQDQAIAIIKKTLLALGMLHDRGYVHRDIDPSNIMICNGSDSVKLIDFGIVKSKTDIQDAGQGTIFGQFIGKPRYAAPEQARGEHDITDGRSDLYSTGITLYQLLCGRVPFEGQTNEIIRGHQNGIIQYDESISSSLRYVIDKATAKLQEDRYQSAHEFIVDLDRVERGEVLSAKKPKSNMLWIAIAGGIVALLLMIAGLGSVVVSKHNKTIEQAEQQLSIGLYQSSLDLYKGANSFLVSDEAKTQMAMLEVLVPAVEAYNGSDYPAAEQLFKDAALYGSADAYYYLGEMCYECMGTPRNYDKGFEYTSKAAELGSELAKYRLGLVYKNGFGVAIDNDRASKYFEDASKIIDNGVESNNPEYLFIKGSMYMAGNHIQQSTNRAIEYFTAAAELDYPQAQYELYLALNENHPTEAIKWLSSAVDHGYPKAEYMMCLVCWADADYARSLEMIQRAAAKNYSPALQTLGVWYATNYNYANIVGLESDNAVSHNYTSRALEYDFENIVAMSDMWSDFSKGNGVAVDIVKANSYKQMALNKLDKMSYVISGNRRVYYASEAQEVWDKLSN